MNSSSGSSTYCVYKADLALTKMTADKINNHFHQENFDPNSKSAIFDNSAIAHFRNNAKYFTDVKPTTNVGIIAARRVQERPSVIVTIKIRWNDDDQNDHVIALQNFLCMPLSPVNLANITKFA